MEKFFPKIPNFFYIISGGLGEKQGDGESLMFGAPGVTRTRGSGIRNPLLYPPELRGQEQILIGRRFTQIKVNSKSNR